MKRKSISWLAIVGKAAGKDDVLTYEGALVQDSNFQTVAIGHVRSNVLFDSGSIKFVCDSRKLVKDAIWF